MEYKFLPCPFCGSNSIDVVKRTAWNTPTYARCINCGSRGPDVFVANIEDSWKTLVPTAINNWNHRPSSASPKAEMKFPDYKNGKNILRYVMDRDLSISDMGWNACLDKCKELNAVKDEVCEHGAKPYNCIPCNREPSEKKECCVAKEMVFTSNPPQYQCKKCGEFWFCHEDTPVCRGEKKECIKHDRSFEYQEHGNECPTCSQYPCVCKCTCKPSDTSGEVENKHSKWRNTEELEKDSEVVELANALKGWIPQYYARMPKMLFIAQRILSLGYRRPAPKKEGKDG